MKSTIRLAAALILAACGAGDSTGVVAKGSIRGTVTDKSGATVANVAVVLTGNAAVDRTANTGADGVYTFTDVQPGEYTLVVTPPAGFTVGAVATTSVTVMGGAEAKASAIVLEATAGTGNGSIRGNVIDQNGAAIGSAAVTLTGNAQPARTTGSDASGIYTFADVPPGTYALAVSPPAGFTTIMDGTISVTVAPGAQANASALVLGRPADTCAIARPDFGGPASAAERAVFAYDANAPLNVQKQVDSTKNGVEFNSISFDSPDGGLATGIMYVPVGRTGLRPGMVVMHAAPGPGPVSGARIAQFEMLEMAKRGAIAIGIDAPFSRRGGPPSTMTSVDRVEHIRLMKELQRAVDVLLAQPNVDATRIGFSGFSYGGMVAYHFAGIEPRVKAGVMTAGYPGSVTVLTDPTRIQMLTFLTCGVRNAWFRDMVPIEGIRYIGGASPTALLFQIANFDIAVLPADAQTAYEAAPGPKEVLYYPTGHGFNAQANQDRWAWLSKQIGIDP